MTEKERMLAGELYRSSDAELVGERRRCRLLRRRYNLTSADELEERRSVLLELIPGAPASLTIEPPFYCDYGYNIGLGEDVYFNFDCVVLDVARITIGSRVLFAPKVQLLTATHPLDWQERQTWELGAPITIGDDVWVGAGAVILPGVTVGPRSVVGAGSIVTRDVPADTVVAGNPARVIRRMGEGGLTF